MNEGEQPTVHNSPPPISSSDSSFQTHPLAVWEYLDLETSSHKPLNHTSSEEEYISPLPPLSTISSHTDSDDEASTESNQTSELDSKLTQAPHPTFLQPQASSEYDPCKPLLGSTISPDKDVVPALKNAKHPEQYIVVALPGVPHTSPDTEVMNPGSAASAPGLVPALKVDEASDVGDTIDIHGWRRSRGSSISSSSSSSSMESLSVEPVDEAVLSSGGSSMNAQNSHVPPPEYTSPDDSFDDLPIPLNDTPNTVVPQQRKFSVPQVSRSPPPGLEAYEAPPFRLRHQVREGRGRPRHHTLHYLQQAEASSNDSLEFISELRKLTRRRNLSEGHALERRVHFDKPNFGTGDRNHDENDDGDGTIDKLPMQSWHTRINPSPGRHRLHKEPPTHAV